MGRTIAVEGDSMDILVLSGIVSEKVLKPQSDIQGLLELGIHWHLQVFCPVHET